MHSCTYTCGVLCFNFFLDPVLLQVSGLNAPECHQLFGLNLYGGYPFIISLKVIEFKVFCKLAMSVISLQRFGCYKTWTNCFLSLLSESQNGSKWWNHADSVVLSAVSYCLYIRRLLSTHVLWKRHSSSSKRKPNVLLSKGKTTTLDTLELC